MFSDSIILCIRKKFTSQIDQILENLDASNVLNNMNLAMVDSALCQENFNIAKKYLLQSEEKVLHDYCSGAAPPPPPHTHTHTHTHTRAHMHAHAHSLCGDIIYIDHLTLLSRLSVTLHQRMSVSLADQCNNT
jgi:hypothetical protein